MAAGRVLARLLDRRRWPVRWWLSLATAAIAGGTVLALGIVLLTLLDGRLQRQLGENLRSQAEPVLRRELDAPLLVPPPAPPTPPFAPKPRSKTGKSEWGDGRSDPAAVARLQELAPALIGELAGRDTGVVVYDVRHRVIAVSSTGGRRERWPLAPPDALERAIGGAETERALSEGPRRTLIVLLPIRERGDEVIGVLELATSLELVDSLWTQVGIALAVGTLLAVVVAGGLAGSVSRAALGPLDRMIRVTRRIAAGDLAARTGIDRQDEVGELAAAFDQMVGRLEAAFATQRRLVSDAAHELRTPLNGLAGTLEIVQVALDRGDPDAARRLLATVERELDRAGRLVNDLLTLSSLDERATRPTSPVALVPVLRDVVRRARLLAPDHEIVAHLDAPAEVVGDRDQLERVFSNLLDNAIKYTPAGGRIDVELERRDGEVRVAIRDTGRGIPADDLPRIFERFYRADRARSRQEGGAGLGLAIVQAIVTAHGGRVEAESTPGVGTTIRVLLPAAPVALETSTTSVERR
jgi:two-component system, OmpR family, sensor kinase